MLTMKIRSVRVLPLAGTVTLMAGIWGVLIGAVNAILFARGLEPIPGGPAKLPSFANEGLFGPTIAESALSLFGFTVIFWLFYGLIMGFVGGISYNVASVITGGATIAPEIIVEVERPGERNDSISYEEYIRQHLVPALPESEEETPKQAE